MEGIVLPSSTGPMSFIIIVPNAPPLRAGGGQVNLPRGYHSPLSGIERELWWGEAATEQSELRSGVELLCSRGSPMRGK